MEVKNTVLGDIPVHPINAELGSDLVIEKAMIYG